MRGRATDPRTCRQRNVLAPFPGSDANAAYRWLQSELAKIRAGTVATPLPRERFCDFAVSLLARKIADGTILSAKTRDQWGSVLKCHLIPAFGAMYLDAIRRADIEAWRSIFGAKILAGDYSPHTGNDILAVLRVVLTAAFSELELPRNPIAGVASFDTRARTTYTVEEPNSLTADEVPRFLAEMRRRYPQFFAITALGLATGLRPSTLRPIRRVGPTPDVLWETSELLVRQSHTRRAEVMPTTKTDAHQRLALPADVMAILIWHVGQLPAELKRKSDLLFPGRTGKFLGSETLQKPFREVAKAIGLAKHITPRAMRRTFQDLCRAAEVQDIVTRAVSGHATAEMQRHYSTVTSTEMRASLTRVVVLGGFQAALAANDGVSAAPSGVKSGVKARRTKKAG